MNELFNQNLEKTDTLNRVVVHTLRHTFGSQLVINGVDIYTVQKLMNHSNISKTMRYAKLNDKIKGALDTSSLNEYTQAHLNESINKIQSVYTAQTILNKSNNIAVIYQASNVDFLTIGRIMGNVHAPYLYNTDKKI